MTQPTGPQKATVFETEIVLGEHYRDQHTGIVGVATAVYFYEHGCERVNVEQLDGDGVLQSYAFDAPRLTHVALDGAGTMHAAERPVQTSGTGGPGLSTERRAAPGRR